MKSHVQHAPEFSKEQATELARVHFDVAGTLRPLPSERDQNFLVTEPAGQRHVLKIGNAAEPREVLELQNLALDHLQARIDFFRKTSAPLLFDVPWPVVHRSSDGRSIVDVEGASGDSHALRLLSWVPGTPLGAVRPHRASTLRGLGVFLGALDRTLDGFSHVAAGREFVWDLRRAEAVVRMYAPEIDDPEERALVERFAEGFESRRQALGQLRTRIIHNDGNDYNVMVDLRQPTGPDVCGIVDFGDMIESWLAAEPAIAAAYAALDKQDPVGAACDVVAGYHRTFPLEESEVEQLYVLISMRLVMSVCISAHQLRLAPDNAYLGISRQPAWRALDRLAAVHPDLAHYRLRYACGFEPRPQSARLVRWLEQRSPAQAVLPADYFERPAVVFDLSPGSLDPAAAASADESRAYAIEDADGWTERLFAIMRSADTPLGVGRYDEPRRVYTAQQFALESEEQPRRRTIHLGIDLFAPAGTAVRAPFDARVESVQDNDGPLDYGPTVILTHETEVEPGVFHTLYGHLARESVRSLRPGMTLAAGESFAMLGEPGENGGWPPHLHFQIVTNLLGHRGNFPGVADPDQRQVWCSVCPDPSSVLGLANDRFPQPEPAAHEILTRRRGALGPSLSLAYRRPLHIVRGSRQYLYDAEGRAYLDAVNNVPHVGHCHPRVVAAAAAQAAVLNTNTRYLHRHLVEYVERLLETLPEPLDRCFLVCSGSEANELALRMARAHTGRTGVIAVEGGYHGNTQALIEISSYKFDGQGGAGRPQHVRALPTPDAYRGLYRSPADGLGERYAAHVADAAAQLELAGVGLSAFICESLLGCGGQLVPPTGYLNRAYANARDLGAVVIADEVQVGFGRVGRCFWGFELQAALPDIVTLGKPIGNGHPLAAVITTRAVAESFANGMEYFNTFGGNPVSCAIGLAVLDVIRDEGLQQHALRVGERLKRGLADLMSRHTIVGDVRGEGLFVGVELVLDPDQKTPAADQASYIQERMLEHGILIGVDGPRHNVLKLKPPLVFDAGDAERLVETLDKILSEDFLATANDLIS